MIQTHPNYLDQTQIIGFGIPIGWHGAEGTIPVVVTPSSRIVIISAENRTEQIVAENRTSVIAC